MITDAQIIEAVRAMLPLDLFALVHVIGSALILPPVTLLERAMEAPVIGWLATLLWIGFIAGGGVGVWVLALALWVSAVLVFTAVIVVSPILAAIATDALALPRALVGL